MNTQKKSGKDFRHKDCVCYREYVTHNGEIRGYCTGYTSLLCRENQDCSCYKTQEDIALEEKIRALNEATANGKGNRLCKTDCKYWNPVTCRCQILKAPFCATDKDCSFYKRHEKLFRWHEVKHSPAGGWKETGKYECT